jgi:hypothetical protein
MKLEKHDEKWAGGAEVSERFKLWSPAINGIGREKMQKARNNGQVAAKRRRRPNKFEKFRGFSRSPQNIVEFSLPLRKMRL